MNEHTFGKSKAAVALAEELNKLADNNEWRATKICELIGRTDSLLKSLTKLKDDENAAFFIGEVREKTMERLDYLCGGLIDQAPRTFARNLLTAKFREAIRKVNG